MNMTFWASGVAAIECRSETRDHWAIHRSKADGKRGPGSRWLVGILLAISLPVCAQQAPAVAPKPATRPRIGLVLGGGGAKGAAHVGVLKVLEELRIPVDVIAGTSMGSIVGAAYASGMSSEDLTNLMNEVDWKGVITGAPRELIPYHRKKYDSIYTMGLTFGVKKDGLVLPGGLVSTHQIEALLRRVVTSPGQEISFDGLPIPFRAVATDLESGEMAVFDHGDLTVALRASMAVPGAFSPVDLDGRVYADGMLVRNLPIDVARTMGADIVISVQVGNPPLKRSELGSLLAVAGQALNIAIEANEKAQLDTLSERDTPIKVVLQEIGSGDFDKVPEAIPLGEIAAREVTASLSRYSLPKEEYAQWRANLDAAAKKAVGTVDEVRLAGFNTTNPEVMKTFIKTQPGDTYDRVKADEDATRLVARGDFASVNQYLQTEGERKILNYAAVEKSWGPDYLIADMNLSSDLQGVTAWGIRLDYEKRWMNKLGGELRTAFQFGRPNLVNVEFYQPLDLEQRFFVAPSLFWKQQLEDIYWDNDKIAEVSRETYYGKLEGGMAFGNWGEYRIGVQRGGIDSETQVGDHPFDSFDAGFHALAGVTTRFAFDTLDAPMFASRGVSGSVTGYLSETGLGADETYKLVTGRFGTTLSTDPYYLMLHLTGGSDLNTDVPYYDAFRLGGLFNFSGYAINELLGEEYVLGRIALRGKVAQVSEMLGTALYLGSGLEIGNVYGRKDGTHSTGTMMVGGSVFLGYDSLIGPLILAYGLSEGGHSAIYFYIGSAFELFRQ